MKAHGLLAASKEQKNSSKSGAVKLRATVLSPGYMLSVWCGFENNRLLL